MKIRPVGAELFHVDGRTDMTNVIVSFNSFAKAPKNDYLTKSNASVLHIANFVSVIA
jgi:hypothetical protein